LGLPRCDDLVEALRLDEPTKGRLLGLVADFNRQASNLFAKGPSVRAGMDDFMRLRKEAEARMLEVLSPQQRAEYQRLLGRPFKQLPRRR